MTQSPHEEEEPARPRAGSRVVQVEGRALYAAAPGGNKLWVFKK